MMDDDDNDEIPCLIPASIEVKTTDTVANDNVSSIESKVEKSIVVEDDNTTKVSISRIPITILTGWLGAGKTTLLRYLMKANIFEDRSVKIAVIQNEFSSLGVEEGLLLQNESGNLGQVLEMPNGCVCCSVKTNFTLAVEELVKTRSFDFIIVECSGLADPGPLATMFWVDEEELESPVYLDGIVSVVDAQHVLGHLNESQPHSKQVIRQLAYADRIILNKLDLLKKNDNTDDEKNKIMNVLSTLNPGASIISTTNSVVPVDQVLNLRAFGQVELSLPSIITAQDPTVLEHVHDQSITSIVLESNKPLDEAKFSAWLDNILWADSYEDNNIIINNENKNDNDIKNNNNEQQQEEQEKKGQEIFRVKAMLHFSNKPNKYFIQAVQATYDLICGEQWDENEERTSRMVVIGRNLEEDNLREGFVQCGC